jgi:trans-aconitate methyltransferase
MQSPRNTPSNDPIDAARDYWIDRAASVTGTASVLPAGRWLRYHAWTNRLLQDWTLAQLDRPRFRRCVDLGCGRGEWTALFAPRADEVHACDVAEPFVAETRQRLDALHHTSWNVEQADLRGYRIPEGIDLAYVGAVLCYLDDDGVRDVLYRLRLATNPYAQVIVRDYCTINLGRPSINTSTGFSIHRRPADLVALAESVGMRCQAVRSSPSIYAEAMGNAITRWPLRLAWRLATAHWTRASHTFVFRA